MSFRVKRKPNPPKRSTFTIERGIYGETLAQVIESIPKDVPFEKVRFETDYDSPTIRYETLEDEGLYQNRVAMYKKKLAEWEKWKKENIEFVKEWEARQSAIKEQKREKKLSQIEKEIARLEKLRKNI